jgi:hypothetical protein
MAQEEEPGFEPLRSARLPKELHNALENSLLLVLQFGSRRFCLAERVSYFQLGFKTTGTW